MNSPLSRPGALYLTVDEVASLLRVSRMTIYRAVERGEIPANRIGRSIRIREKDLDVYLRDTDTSAWSDEDGAA